MTNTNLTAEQAMEIAIAKVKEARKQAKNEAKLALIENTDYVGLLASIEEEAETISKLTLLIDTVNSMKDIKTNDGTKYSVNCYSVSEYIFGPVMGKVLGLITGSSAMFTDERQAEFQAITGINYLTFTKARSAIGSPAYFSKGKYSSQMEGDGESVNSIVLAILQGLDIDIEYANKLSQHNIDKWFTVSDDKARKLEKEFKLNEVLDSTEAFTLED